MRFVLVLLVAAAALLAAAAPADARPLPVVSIDVRGVIPNDAKVRARVRMPGYDGWGGIEIRGQSSARLPKKSFSLELRTAAGRKRDAALLGMPADDDWVLYASQNDPTLMRNVVAYAAARATGRWAAATRYVELRLRGRYHGIYVLMERPELGPARVDVPRGAYLFELTHPFQAVRKGPHFITPLQRRAILWEDPELEDLTAEQALATQELVVGLEQTLYSGRGGAWREVLDSGAAVDYVLVQELFRNVDAFRASTFLTKPPDGRMRLGPVWDFDRSSGNSLKRGSELVEGWFLAHQAWASQLHRDPDFAQALAERWSALRAAGFREMVLRAADRARRVLAPHVQRQFRRWPSSVDHATAVGALRAWLERRMAWLDVATGQAGGSQPRLATSRPSAS